MYGIETLIVGDKKWILSYEELTEAYLSGLYPQAQNKLLALIKRIAGGWWIIELKKIKNYRKIPIDKLRQLKTSKEKLGSGVYATVYAYNSYAIKVINHKFYKNLPRIDGRLEAEILKLLKQKITYSYKSPNIITSYQFTSDSKTDYIVLEKHNTTLWSYIRTKRQSKTIRAIILQVLFTLVILQHVFPGFRHNDLKIDNILLDYRKRTERLGLVYQNYAWELPPNVPLVKIADFDYANIPRHISNPKVGTPHTRSFGCTAKPSKIYDSHLFLNSLYSSRKKLPGDIVGWLEDQLPAQTRGAETSAVKFSRLKNPDLWNRKINTPLKLIISNFFVEFKTKKVKFPMWGIKD